MTANAIAAGEGQEAAALLERTRETVNPELRRTVESLPGSMRRVAMYHFGWEDEEGRPTDGGTGKAIRPALVLASAQALGGPFGGGSGGPGGSGERGVVRAAVAVELAHNFTLLHDDVIDKDVRRRGRPTAWTVFGIPDAIITGDAVMALALRLFAEDPHPAAAAASARLAACVIELCAGQQADCAFERRPDVALDECLTMATAKTGALLGCACALGALYAGAGPEEVEAMDAFGREAGLAFQLIDDLIGIWGIRRTPGSPPGPICWPARSPSRSWPPSPRAPAPGRSWPICTRARWPGTTCAPRPAPWSGPAGGTGRRPMPPTGWAGRCRSCPGPSRTLRRRAGCWPWRSS